MKVENVQVGYQENPIGVQNKSPLLSFQVKMDGEEQVISYQVVAASSVQRLEQNQYDLWDSGKMNDTQFFAIKYKGKSLSSREQVFWKARVWNEKGEPSEWSRMAYFEMGLLEESDWKADWIGWGSQKNDKSTAPMLAGSFFVSEVSDIVTARAYVSGLGMYIASLNGRSLDDSFFNPGESDYEQTVYYVTYDILKELQSGENVFGMLLGNGQYVNFIENPVMTDTDGNELPAHRYQKNDGKFVKKGIYGAEKCLVQIELTFKNGKIERFLSSNKDWRITDSPITFNNWYGGEDYDATRAFTDWNKSGCDRSGWKQPECMEAPQGKLIARDFPTIRIQDEWHPVKITKTQKGTYLADAGKNFAGTIKLKLNTKRSQRGTKIKIYPAELLNQDETGVDQASCTQSWNERYHCDIMDSYIVAGAGKEEWNPVFCYHGFRYVEVEDFPGEFRKDNLLFCQLRMNNKKEGDFYSSDPILNSIEKITNQSIESNMFFSFTDCPHIEKLGWIETSHLMFRSMANDYDIRAWIPEIARSIRDSQITKESREKNPDETEKIGYIPAITPEYQRIVGLHRDTNWSGACILTPWEYYNVYGDKTLLEEGFTCMAQYLKYLSLNEENGLLREGYNQMGDWGQIREDTPTMLVQNCSYYYLLVTMEKICYVLNREKEADNYQKKSQSVAKAFHENTVCYNKEQGIYGNGSQASYGCVLFSGINQGKDQKLLEDKLELAVEKRDYHLSSGEVGLKQVIQSLARAGKNETVYKMIMNKTWPSYRYFIDQKLTSLPEYWNYNELWYGMARSRNHAMMGHVKEWLIGSVLGFKIREPGCRRIEISPALTTIIKSAKGMVFTPYGKVSIVYEWKDGIFHLSVDLPVGVAGEVNMKINNSLLNKKLHSGRNEYVGE